jgi:hypothetical protein
LVKQIEEKDQNTHRNSKSKLMNTGHFRKIGKENEERTETERRKNRRKEEKTKKGLKLQ